MSIGVMLFNPFTGKPRHPDDIASDPRGILVWDGEEPLKVSPPQRRAEPEQEPVAWMLKSGHGTEFKEQLTDELKALTWKGKPMWTPLYTAPPQRKPLSNEQRDAIARQAAENDWHDYEIIDAVEAAHGIKE